MSKVRCAIASASRIEYAGERFKERLGIDAGYGIYLSKWRSNSLTHM